VAREDEVEGARREVFDGVGKVSEEEPEVRVRVGELGRR